MSRGFGIEIAKVKNEEMLEDLILDICSHNPEYENAQRNGSRGQKQDGVDIFCRDKATGKWIGLQCKVRTNGKLTKKDIDNEIEKALKFNPTLDQYYIFTTAKRDSVIQEYIRVISEEHRRNRLFDLYIRFWDDIESILNDKVYEEVHFKYYKRYYRHIKEDGYSFGKLIHLTVGYKQLTSRYEFIIGKTYQKNSESYDGINYWKNLYYMMNMSDRTFEIIPRPCYAGSIPSLVRSHQDKCSIALWLNSIEDWDNLIYSEETDYKYELSEEEYKNLL